MKKERTVKIIMIPSLIGNIAAYAFINKCNFLYKNFTIKINSSTPLIEIYTGKIQSIIFLNNLK